MNTKISHLHRNYFDCQNNRLGVIHKWRHPRGGGRGVLQKVTRGDKGEVPCFNQRWRHPNVYFQNTTVFKLITPLQNLVLKLDLSLGLMVQNGAIYVNLGFVDKLETYILDRDRGRYKNPGKAMLTARQVDFK